MNEEELRQYGHIASLEISNMQHTIDNLQQENHQLKDNWNELKKWLEEEIKHLEKSRYVSFNEYGENKLRIFKEFQFKMQELESDK